MMPIELNELSFSKKYLPVDFIKNEPGTSFLGTGNCQTPICNTNPVGKSTLPLDQNPGIICPEYDFTIGQLNG